ncbi:MAG: ATP-grasp domain-containing protein [Deltaproteobacteria bacterium]|nr:ATP-grasp domain-containing protein [Deltaproteobacteria bacterium]
MATFSKILVANRGEIASRIIRTIHAMGKGAVAIYADPDLHAPFVRDADEAIAIGPPLAAASFLAIDKIVTIAKRVGADAVHPGYGFLAENADFARAVTDAGLAFIGPPAAAIRSMGDKIEAKRLMQQAGVPVIPGFAASQLPDEEIISRCQSLGYPLLIKAARGGGGKGMRVVNADQDLGAALGQARAEAKSAFGDDTLLVERYLPSARHIEVQILADRHGQVLHCFERECSIQRRHQKVIEEAPATNLDPKLAAALRAAAVSAARAVGYQSAGTVELLVHAGGFYFLEMNTRLQVEHPVTEEITGLDLVRLQIEVAEGARLALTQDQVTSRGHAIEARLYAEDPRADYLPSTGTLVAFEPVSLPGVRYDAGVATSYEVSSFYDPLLAKIIAHGATRDEARRRLLQALGRLCVMGVRTNLELLVAALEHPEFGAGNLSTEFIDAHRLAAPALTPAHRKAVLRRAVAATLWGERRRHAAALLPSVPSGWRNNPSQMQRTRFAIGDEVLAVDYRLQPRARAEVRVGDELWAVQIAACDARHITLVIDDVCRTYRVAARADRCFVHGEGHSELRELSRFPEPGQLEAEGSCLAPVPGKVLAIFVTPGDVVTKAQPLLSIEAMKMEHRLSAPRAGVVRGVPVQVGEQVEAGALLVDLEAGE